MFWYFKSEDVFGLINKLLTQFTTYLPLTSYTLVKYRLFTIITTHSTHSSPSI